MNTIKKTLMAGLLACATFNAQAEVNPFSYGIKAGAGLSFARGASQVKINSQNASSSFFDTPLVYGTLYTEYAYTDYLGIGIEAGYMNLGSTLTAKQNNNANNGNNNQTGSSSDQSIGITSHGIVVPFHAVQIYPLGREEESGILKINLGGTHYIPLSTTCKKDNNKLDLNDNQKKELPSYIAGPHIGVGYEFPFGLSIDAKYTFLFNESFNVEDNAEQTIFDNAKVGNNNEKFTGFPTHHTIIGIGYNFMSLFD